MNIELLSLGPVSILNKIIERLHIEGSVIAAAVIEGVTALNMFINKTNLRGLRMTGCHLDNMVIENCTIDGAIVDGVPLAEALNFWRKHNPPKK